MKASKVDCLEALLNVDKDAKAFNLIESLINEHFSLIEHMKETSLYDVLKYADRVVQPLEILAYDNEKLKKEVNDLRKQLGLGNKYKVIK